MVYSGLEFTGKVPFKNIIIHGTVLTKDGKRMSKSLGTGVDPLELIEKYGADATRFGLIYQSIGGQQDIKYGEEFILTGKKFANKLWNIARYIVSRSTNFQAPNDEQIENEIIIKTKKLSEEVNNQIQQYQFGEALHLLYHFIWHEYADKFIEDSKDKSDPETFVILHSSFFILLKLLHPFMPFVTEHIWGIMGYHAQNRLLMVEKWPNQ